MFSELFHFIAHIVVVIFQRQRNALQNRAVNPRIVHAGVKADHNAAFVGLPWVGQPVQHGHQAVTARRDYRGFFIEQIFRRESLRFGILN